jgi:hypothetical protein
MSSDEEFAAVSHSPSPQAGGGAVPSKRSLTPAGLAAMQAGRSAQRAGNAEKAEQRLAAGAGGREGRILAAELRAEIARRDELRENLDVFLGPIGDGVPVSRERACCALATFYVDENDPRLPLKDGSLTTSARYQLACLISGLSTNTVKKLVARYEFDGELGIEEPGRRGAGAASYSRWLAVPPDAEEKLKSFFEREVINNKTPTWVTRQVVQDFFRDQYDVDFSLFVISRILKTWGYAYGKLSRAPAGDATPARLLQKQIYVVQLDNAIKKGHIIYWSDESYANVRLAFSYSWGPIGRMHSQSVKEGGLGQRLCFVQVLGRDGLLVKTDAAGSPILPPAGDIKNEFESGEMMFAAQKGALSKGDYHGNFNRDNFIGLPLHSRNSDAEAQTPRGFYVAPDGVHFARPRQCSVSLLHVPNRRTLLPPRHDHWACQAHRPYECRGVHAGERRYARYAPQDSRRPRG